MSQTNPAEPGEEDESMEARPRTPRLAEEAVEDGETLQETEEGQTIENWSDNEIPESERARILESIPIDIRKEVRRTHSGLGHPEKTVFLRMLRLGGAAPEALEYAKVWQCPVCQAKKRPPKPQVAGGASRPFGFNEVVSTDLKYLKDSLGETFVILHVVCSGTSWHAASLIKTRQPEYVAQKFMEIWISHYGPPKLIIADQGGEFQSHFLSFCEDYGIDVKMSGSHAPWQNALAERHGAILGEMWEAVVYEHQARGLKDCRLALMAVITAKNSLLTRNGITPVSYTHLTLPTNREV